MASKDEGRLETEIDVYARYLRTFSGHGSANKSQTHYRRRARWVSTDTVPIVWGRDSLDCSLMAACWMAHCGVKTRIVDKRNTKIFCGQADGLQCRSLEIFDSFGYGDRAWKEANHMLEVIVRDPAIRAVC